MEYSQIIDSFFEWGVFIQTVIEDDWELEIMINFAKKIGDNEMLDRYLELYGLYC